MKIHDRLIQLITDVKVVAAQASKHGKDPKEELSRFVTHEFDNRRNMSAINRLLHRNPRDRFFMPSDLVQKAFASSALDQTGGIQKRKDLIKSFIEAPNLPALNWLIKERQYRFSVEDVLTVIKAGSDEALFRIIDHAKNTGLCSENPDTQTAQAITEFALEHGNNYAKELVVSSVMDELFFN